MPSVLPEWPVAPPPGVILEAERQLQGNALGFLAHNSFIIILVPPTAERRERGSHLPSCKLFGVKKKLFSPPIIGKQKQKNKEEKLDSLGKPQCRNGKAWVVESVVVGARCGVCV